MRFVFFHPCHARCWVQQEAKLQTKLIMVYRSRTVPAVCLLVLATGGEVGYRGDGGGGAWGDSGGRGPGPGSGRQRKRKWLQSLSWFTGSGSVICLLVQSAGGKIGYRGNGGGDVWGDPFLRQGVRSQAGESGSPSRVRTQGLGPRRGKSPFRQSERTTRRKKNVHPWAAFYPLCSCCLLFLPRGTQISNGLRGNLKQHAI